MPSARAPTCEHRLDVKTEHLLGFWHVVWVTSGEGVPRVVLGWPHDSEHGPYEPKKRRSGQLCGG